MIPADQQFAKDMATAQKLVDEWLDNAPTESYEHLMRDIAQELEQQRKIGYHEGKTVRYAKAYGASDERIEQFVNNTHTTIPSEKAIIKVNWWQVLYVSSHLWLIIILLIEVVDTLGRIAGATNNG